MQNQAKRLRLNAFIMIMAVIMLVVAGCGGNNNSANTGNNGSNSNVAAEENTAANTEHTGTQSEEVRVIEHAMGSTEIEGTPERVVILTNEGTEALLAVGVKPVGAVMSWIGDPWYDHIKDEMEGVEMVGDELQPNIELIASLQPDLIIGNKVRQEKIYDQLNQIAPTVFAEDLAGDWKINFALYTDALNKKAEGEELMAAYDQRVEEVKSKLGDKADTKVSVVRFTAGDVRIYQKQTFSGVLLSQLGVARPASQDKDQFIEKLTKERIPDMDGDVMFYFVSEAPGSSDAANVAKDWLEDPLFQSLNVAKNDKVIEVNEAIWNTAGGYKAANLLLDEIAAYFEVQ
ncbi:ABC transporter substrate-binding protein [Marinicrinis sediminis]|uniref:ABC transporter substrate-binding protein n=1 Tax=Marinicrinis sediminis TaxID=1652465 RepID=A0ABW5RG11_9BACL